MSPPTLRRRVLALFVFVLLVLATAPPSATAAPGPRPSPAAFDLQAHRGGIGLIVESTLAAFSRALEVGVTTLELDVQITQDGVAVVTHDRRVNSNKCQDTAPAVPGDPEYPYGGDYVNTLTVAQVKTLDCGSRTLPQYPGQQADPGARMPTLTQVFDLVHRYRADQVMLNVETKVEAGAPSETAPREQFVQAVAGDVRQARMLDQVTVQSFDWGALMRMSEVEPSLPLVALTNYDFLQVDQPGASPWLGGIDIDDFDDSLVAAADSFGASAISPVHGFPQGGRVGDDDYRPYVTREMVSEAHAAGLDVVPWTVNDLPTMESLMDNRVDGLITDYPDRLRDLMAERRMRLPRAYRAPRGAGVEPLAQAHAHNDYEHERPLYDALGHGFTSVEADVWLVDGELLVAHDHDAVQSGRTLQSLYLEPLRDRIEANGGSVYRGWSDEFQLLIDVKTEAEPTYAAIDRALRDHAGMMTTFVNGTHTRAGAVTAVISGNRPLQTMQDQQIRRARYDGRLSDLGTGPARRALWSELVESGVDHINTDDLAGLQAFLQDQRTARKDAA